MAAMAAESNQRQDALQILSYLTHEIRTPLSSMLALSQLLRAELAGPLTAEQQKYMEVIERSVEKLNRLIGDVLDLSRLETGTVEIEPRYLDLAELIRTTAAELAPGAAAKSVNLAVHPMDNLPQVRCDPDRLRHVLKVLIENALEFTDRGQVALSATAGEGEVVVQVSDTGIGIPKSALASLFEGPFFPTVDGVVRRPMSRRSGAGLGLAIASRSIALMGGRMSAESDEGIGTRFIFTLPTGDRRSSPAPTKRTATVGSRRKATRKNQRS